MQASVYDRFIQLLVTKAREFVVGDPFDEATAGGPLISKAQYDRVWSYIESGKKEGAKVVVGGEKRTSKGFFVDPCGERSSSFIKILVTERSRKSSRMLSPR